jgi:hypothetical protein
MRKLRSKRLGFERLERRAMLAGDVQVTIEDGTLFITGDDEDNHVIIEGTGVGGNVVIEGADDTTIFLNGVEQFFPVLILGANFDSIDVDLNAGDDTLEMNNVAVIDLIITMDEGADVVRLGAYVAYAANPAAITPASGSIVVDGLFDLDTGSGADLVEAVRVLGVADWDINLGDSDGTNNNNDDRDDNNFFVTLDDQLYIFIGAGEVIDINGGTGDDLVNINYLNSNGILADPLLSTLVIDGVAGNDVLSINGSAFQDNVLLLGGDGFDTVAIDFSRHDAGVNALIEIDSGADGDFILFARSLIEEGEVFITAGGGFDRVVIGRYYANARGDLATGGNVVGTVDLDTGGQGDVADIRGNDVLEFFATFGGGDDDVDFINNIVRDEGLLDGGFGFDRLTFFGNLVNNFDVIGFENENFLFDADF